MNPSTTTIKGTFSFQQWYPFGENIRKEGKEVVLAGDGRHDSMGHSAKFGTYTMFCCTAGLIIHVVLVQVGVFTLFLQIFFLPVYYLKGLAGL